MKTADDELWLLWMNVIVSKKWRLLLINLPRKLSIFGVYEEKLAHVTKSARNLNLNPAEYVNANSC